MRRSWRWALGTMLLVCTAVRAQGPSADLRGIYVGGNNIVNENAKSLTAALTVPGVDGFLLNIGWDQIEPVMGQYQWATLDQWMSSAILAGKKITVSVGDGMHTPSWLFQAAPGGAGAKPLNFSISRKGGLSNVCDQETIAAPWDTAFLKQWDSMLAALSAHLKSAGTYNAVTLLRLTGINRDTDELHLPEETAQSTGLACVSDAIATWQQAGYRPSLLLQGWDGITSSFQKYFPDKSFSVAIIARTNTPFPPIAEDGSIMTGTIPDLSGPPLTLASQKFPGHLVIQNNSLYPGVPAQPATIQFAQSLGTMLAFQTNEDLGASNGKAAGCGTSFAQMTPCTSDTYAALLATGIYPLGQSNSLRPQYIELFAADAITYPADILQAHYQLLPYNSKNSASYSTLPLAPDMIAFGEAASVAGGPVVAPSGPWPPTLGGARLDITDSGGQTRPALLYFVTNNQLGYLIPAGTALGHASLKLTTFAGATVTDGFQVERISPGLYTANSSGSGVAAGIWIRAAANGTQTHDYLYDPSQAIGGRTPVPVDLGASTDQVFLSLYGTGFRGATQATATVGGLPVTAAFAATGIYQGEDVVNVGPLPRSLAGQGVVNIVITFDAKPANTVTASIR